MALGNLHHEVLHGPEGAPTVLLSNSLGSTMSMWDATVPALSPHFTVVRYDTRGHGASAVVPGPATIDDLADDVLTIMDQLGLETVHFVGLSLGGMTGMRLAARNPERIHKLAVLCTGAYLPPSSGWTERAATVRDRGTAAVAQTVVSRWYTPGLHERDPERIRAAVDTVSATPAEGYAACCEAIAGMDLRGDLASITAPTLAIAGEDDPATPPPFLQEIAQGVAQGELLVVPESAHLANDEQPEIVNNALLHHLRADG